MRVLSPRGNFAVRVEATDDLSALDGADVVVLGLKAYSLPEVARSRRPSRSRHSPDGGPERTAWWYFQRHEGPFAGTVLESVDPGGVLSSTFDPRRVVGCVVYPATEVATPGVIRHVEGTRLAIGEPDGSPSERCTAIAESLRAGGLKCNIEAALRNEIWLKLIGNAALNPVSALCGATLGELARSPGMVELLRALLEEAAAVGARLGVELPVSLERRLEAAFEVGDHRTSMLMDREAGKPLEHQCMTGAIIELARHAGRPRATARDRARVHLAGGRAKPRSGGSMSSEASQVRAKPSSFEREDARLARTQGAKLASASESTEDAAKGTRSAAARWLGPGIEPATPRFSVVCSTNSSYLAKAR